MPNISALQRERFRDLEKGKSIIKEDKRFKSRTSGFLREKLRMNKKDN